MLHDMYTHEMLAKAAANNMAKELAVRRALAELPRRPGVARRVARLSGRMLVRAGARLIAYGTGRPRRISSGDLGPYVAPTSFSQN